MPPQQSNPGYGPTMPIMPSQAPGQFDFITSPGSPTPGNKLTDASTVTRIAIFVGGLVVLALCAWIFFSIITHHGAINTATLIPIAQQQTEIARVSQQPATIALNQTTQNFAESTYLNVLTDQLALTTFMKQHGVKAPTVKTLALKKDTSTDTTLKAAQISGTYDSTYISITQTQLTEYEQSISQAFTTTKSISEKKLLQMMYQDAQLLITMSKQS